LTINSKVNTMKVSIFVPVYNEEKIIEKNMVLIDQECKDHLDDYELFIVDDGSTMQTVTIGKWLDKKYPNITYLRFDNGPSRRENVGKAFKQAKGDIIMFVDVDLATGVHSIFQLVEEIVTNGYDIAIGSRYKGTIVKRKLSRKIISITYNKFMQLYFGSKIEDHQCGIKAFRKDVIFDVMDKVGYDQTFNRGWFWDVELLLWAQKKGYKIVESPMNWEYRESSSFSVKRELRMLKYIFKFKKRYKKESEKD